MLLIKTQDVTCIIFSTKVNHTGNNLNPNTHSILELHKLRSYQ